MGFFAQHAVSVVSKLTSLLVVITFYSVLTCDACVCLDRLLKNEHVWLSFNQDKQFSLNGCFNPL